MISSDQEVKVISAPIIPQFGMDPKLLHVFAPRFNPLGFSQPHQHWERFAQHMLDSGVHLTVVECVSPGEDFHCTAPPMSDPAHADRFQHIGVYAKTRAWTKENLIVLGVQRTPQAQFIAWLDADITFRRQDWASATVKALLHYEIVQPWKSCLDLGPNGEIIAVHTSFCHQMWQGQPLAPPDWKTPYWIGDGGSAVYPHCLPGDSLVVPGGKVIAASRRPYEGDLVVIRTASGQELSCSLNHPVFSGSGWVRADRLNVGDNVLRHVRGNGLLGKPDEKQPPARIEDVVRSFSERAGRDRFAHLLPDDLDNNRSNCKVAEVWADRHLTTERHASSAKQSGDFNFGRIGHLTADRFDRLGSHDLLCQALGLATPANQPTASAGFTPELFGGLFEHPNADRRADLLTSFGARSIPGQSATGTGNLPTGSRCSMRGTDISGNALGDDLSRIPFIHADDPGALRRGLAGQVELDEVVYVGRREFLGHLYDLQTENGYIIADGILTHNSGFGWGTTRAIWDAIGGLFEYGAMGSADHHMAASLAGLAHKTLPPGNTSANYCAEVLRWQRRAQAAINGNVGYVDGVIEHSFHGAKRNRSYIGRWAMFLEHGFDPLEDLCRNSYGVWEFATKKPRLRRAFDRYLHSRNEDGNSM